MKLTSPLFLSFSFFAFIFLMVSHEPLLIIFGWTTAAMAVHFLWPPGATVILLMPLSYQWLQVNLRAIEATFANVPINEISYHGADLVQGTAYGNAALVALILGIRLAIGRRNFVLASELSTSLLEADRNTIRQIALIMLVIGHIATILAPGAGGMAQLFYALGAIRLSAVFLLITAAYCIPAMRPFATLVFLLEIALGFGGFFADYRETLIVGIFAIVASRLKIQLSMFLPLAAALALGIVIASFWSYIKPEYRHFVGGGTGLQVITRPLSERVDFLNRAFSDFGAAEFIIGVDRLIHRLGYVDFLSHTLSYVPASVPHEHGARTLAAVTHVFTPRFLFPNKPALVNDTIVTAYYTGLPLSRHPGTSISIGYVGELYIDFGLFGGIVAMLVLGVILGILIRVIWRQERIPLYASVSLAIIPLSRLLSFEIALIKLVGAFIFAAVLIIFTLYLFRRKKNVKARRVVHVA